nr:scavenger receptor class F member 2-like [Crassostrea gigas]
MWSDNCKENRQRGRLAGFSLYVSNTGDIQDSTLCYKDGPQLPPLNFTTECVQFGRYVIFYNERLAGVTYPSGYELTSVFTELCEVIVKGCKELGVYGSQCDIPCPINCKRNACHIKNGSCFNCENGVYGGYCNMTCPNSCQNNTCNIQSGVCLECKHGVYGSYCNQSCPANCKDNTCHIQNGACSSCKPGWTGMNCNKKCTEGWYGDSCGLQCSGHCRDGTTCNHVTGQCDIGCAAGWTGVICETARLNRKIS